MSGESSLPAPAPAPTTPAPVGKAVYAPNYAMEPDPPISPPEVATGIPTREQLVDAILAKHKDLVPIIKDLVRKKTDPSAEMTVKRSYIRPFTAQHSCSCEHFEIFTKTTAVKFFATWSPRSKLTAVDTVFPLGLKWYLYNLEDVQQWSEQVAAFAPGYKHMDLHTAIPILTGLLHNITLLHTELSDLQRLFGAKPQGGAEERKADIERGIAEIQAVFESVSTRLGCSIGAPPPKIVELTIKTMTNKVFKVHADVYDSVEAVKCAIRDFDGTPIDMQRLIYAEKQLVGDRSLRSYGIKGGEMLHLVLNLRGD